MTKTDQKIPEALYCGLMREIKERLEVIRRFCVEDSEPHHGLSHARAHEICYLELRFICELIALASLVAHGDIQATKHPKMQKAYKPGEILDQMARIHPDFYPLALHEQADNQGRLLGWIRSRGVHLNQSDLKTLWVECGDFLHRGSLKEIEEEITPDFFRISQWYNRISSLLKIHMICLIDNKSAFYVAMSEMQTGDVVMVSMDRWPGPNGNDLYAPRG